MKEQVESVNVAQNRHPDVANAHRLWKNVKTAVPLKYVSNFFRLLELSLINTTLYIELNWSNHTEDAESHRRCFLPRIEIKDYYILMDGRNFYDQNINDSMTRYNELLKLTTQKKMIPQDV